MPTSPGLRPNAITGDCHCPASPRYARPWFYQGLFWIATILFMMGGAWFESAAMDPPPSNPILRLEVGPHTAALWDIDVDAAQQYLVSGANDKTVRIWDLKARRLLTVLRPPIGKGYEGRISAVAISPDASVVACGGATGYSWDGSYSVYLFNRRHGDLRNRLKGLPGHIHALAFSRDGQYLAVGQARGIHLFRTSDWSLVGQDQTYENRCSSLDFDAHNRLITGSFDGRLRLYQVGPNQLRKLTEMPAHSHDSLFSVRFSPDGKKVATGFLNSPAVDIYDANDLAYRFSPRRRGAAKNLETVAWSADGNSLFAGGEVRVRGRRGPRTIIYKWPRKGLGKPLVAKVARSPIQDIHPLADGGAVFASYDAAWGILGAHHQRIHIQRPANFSLRWLHRGAGLLISPDATKINIRIPSLGNRIKIFDALREEFVIATTQSAEGFIPPIKVSPQLDIMNWQFSLNPTLNGKRLALQSGERSLCLAIAPDEQHFLLGTEWNLRCFDRRGRLVWRVPFEMVVFSVNISADSRIAVVGSHDGIFRWYRLSDGRKLFSFYPHRDGKRWIAWTPEGKYVASPRGDEMVGWHLNQGREQAGDFYKAIQFERILYRPGIIRNCLQKSDDVSESAATSAKAKISVDSLPDLAPANVVIESPENGQRVKSGAVQLVFRSRQRHLPMRHYSVYVNQIPITPYHARRIEAGEQSAFVRHLTIPLTKAETHIRVEVFNDMSMGLGETTVYTDSPAKTTPRGDLYLLSIGVDVFPNMPAGNLSYAARDAREVGKFFRQPMQKTFKQVFARVLADDTPILPTKVNIDKHLTFLRKARPQDTVIVFLASHGISDSTGNYYFVPRDAHLEEISALGRSPLPRTGADVKKGTTSLVGWRQFFDTLGSIPGKRLLVVDTCQAKRISGVANLHILAKRSAGSEFALLAAAQSDQNSQEYPPAAHGLFTFALLQGLAGKADMNADGRVQLRELAGFIPRFINERYDPSIGPQTPVFEAPHPLRKMVLAVSAQHKGSP